MADVISKQKLVGMPYTEVFGIIIGIIVAKVLTKTVWDVNFSGSLLSLPMSKGTYIFTKPDALNFAVGIVLVVFGSKIHRIVRWIGIGMVLAQLTNEVLELSRDTGVISPEISQIM